jgi:hypothetical protein
MAFDWILISIIIPLKSPQDLPWPMPIIVLCTSLLKTINKNLTARGLTGKSECGWRNVLRFVGPVRDSLAN